MTYDPRKGESPYLGMDDTYEDDVLDLEDEDDALDWQDDDGALDWNDEDDLLGLDDEGALDWGDETTFVPVKRTDVGSTQAGGTSALQREPVQETSAFDKTQVGSPAAIPRTIRRNSRPAAPSPAQDTAMRRPQPAPRDAGRTYETRPSRATSGFLGTATSLVFRLISLALRLLAIGLALYVVASAVLTDAHRATLVRLSGVINMIVPPALLGQFVYESPFGGAFRGDLTIMSIVLFIADWACLRHANNLLDRRDMGV